MGFFNNIWGSASPAGQWPDSAADAPPPTGGASASRAPASEEAASGPPPRRAAASAHVVGVSPNGVSVETITERGQSVSTSALDLCTGVAVGGMLRGPDGGIVSTSVSVFHVVPGASKPGLAIARHVAELRGRGFVVGTYIAGADESSSSSRKTRGALEAMLADLGVAPVRGPYSLGGYSQYLEAHIDDHGMYSHQMGHEPQ